MGALAEFLSESGQKLKAEESVRRQLVAEWQEAIERLYAQMERWLREADTGGVLEVGRGTRTLAEERMGRYTTELLTFGLNGQSGIIWPVARFVVASVLVPGEQTPRKGEGRVDFKHDEVTLYTMYRVIVDGADRWYFVHPGRFGLKRSPVLVEPLDRDTFEAAVLRMLQ